jgi:hypothetical protein
MPKIVILEKLRSIKTLMADELTIRRERLVEIKRKLTDHLPSSNQMTKCNIALSAAMCGLISFLELSLMGQMLSFIRSFSALKVLAHQQYWHFTSRSLYWHLYSS